MREIKFRFWSNHLKRFVAPDDSIFVGVLKDPDMNPMQYTGLKDKNGVEIYEGDIIKQTSTANARPKRCVKWTIKMGNVGWNVGPGLGREDTNLRTIEVIGNVYSNPELLKDKL